MLGDGHRLTSEKPAPACILLIPDVHRRHMHQLMIHECEYPLTGGECFEGSAQWCDIDEHGIIGGRAGCCVTVIRKIL